MIKAAPAPVAILLSEVPSPVPAITVTRLPAAELRVPPSTPVLFDHEAQAPPGRTAYRLPSTQRGPPALPA